ncbi:MAG: DNA mismatch repair protein MutT [Prosthecochloris sp.]|uniref:NUDIX hydrolase n=1 Tax=Prosthecochloris sp. TaxID=290513 RepID=UPI0013C56751|nr:NUDIX hydrolase N-terminal domain-containing protein [Prosthecochloris sp.]NEX13056.1 DNA mismatch repair protein MutT [Prosthecochloris sp.]
MENLWLNYAKRLHSIARTGLTYSQDVYDKERYSEVLEMAEEMLSLIGHVPIERIHNLLSEHSKGYTTPKIDVRGAVFKGDKILLVQEKSDKKWTLPGGFADVGLSASENIEKEIKEEAGISVKAHSIYSIRHKAKGDFSQDARDFYKIYFLCDHSNSRPLNPGLETLDARYFDQNDIPPLSTGRIIEEDLKLAWIHKENPQRSVAFD